MFDHSAIMTFLGELDDGEIVVSSCLYLSVFFPLQSGLSSFEARDGANAWYNF